MLLRINTNPANRSDELLLDRWSPAESTSLRKGAEIGKLVAVLLSVLGL